MAKTSSQKNIFISVKSEFSSKEGMTNILIQIFCKVSWDIKLPPAMRRVYTSVPGEALCMWVCENLVVFCVLCAAACLENVISDLLQVLIQLSEIFGSLLQGLVSVRPSGLTES